MKCRDCPEGRRFARGSVECLRYGIILRADHEGTREGCARNEGAAAAGGSYADQPAAGLPEERWDDIDRLQELLYGA